MAKFILLLCAIISTINAQCTIENAGRMLQRSIYEFSVDLLQRIAHESDYHFVSSPLSAWTLLASASLGAADETLAEMKKVLHLHKHKCFNNKFLEIANLATTVNESDVFLERSSVLFADNKIRINDLYINKISKSKISKIALVSFENEEQTAVIINNFVREATHDTIDDIVTSSDLFQVLLVMTDALFFKGSWAKTFSEDKTEKSEFYNDLGNNIGNVSLMFSLGNYNVTDLRRLQAQVLELPYGENRRFSMFIFLPQRDISLASVIDKLQYISLTAIRNSFLNYGPSPTIVQLPRFKITSDLNNLKELLADMGITAAFDSLRSSFPFISDEPLYISSFIQKSEIEVNEQGTTASAASAAEFMARTSPNKFIANKPFLFMIVNNDNGIPIFTGTFSKPSLF